MIALLAYGGAKVQWRPYTSTGPSPLAASRSAVAPENPAVARGGSRFFLDTADVAEWEALLPLGMFHGVTTNPTLLERAPSRRNGLGSTTQRARQHNAHLRRQHLSRVIAPSWWSGSSAMAMLL